MTQELIKKLAKKLCDNNKMLATAESCTGGGIAHALTEIPGSSVWFERGFVTYSNEAKMELLGVPAEILETFGAVSSETAKAMAEGALQNSHAQVAVSVTGIAGPDGGSEEKPVGTVWFGFAIEGKATVTELKNFSGDRQQIREQAIAFAIANTMKLLSES